MSSAYVLLIDDDASLLRFSMKFLNHLGYQVLTCRSTADARNRGKDAALAVIDLSLVDPPGYQLGSDLLAAWPSLRVILWSGFPFNVEPLVAQYPGRVEFLMKPFAPRMFRDAVERLLGPPPIA